MQGTTAKKERQCTYKLNIEGPSCNHCYRETAIGVTYSEYVSVALGIQHAMRLHRVIFFICCMSGCTIFFHTSQKREDFQKKKPYLTYMFVLTFSKIYVRNISNSRENPEIYNHKCTQVLIQGTRYSCQILMKVEIS
jgi:hypothetical protein